MRLRCLFRVYNVKTGKLKRCLKGSSSDEGALLKVNAGFVIVLQSASGSENVTTQQEPDDVMILLSSNVK